MNKKLLFLLFILLIVYFLGKTTYWYVKADYNNLFFNISNLTSWYNNDSVPTPIAVEVYLDNELFYKNDSLITPYTFLKKRVSLGSHRLNLLIDSCVYKEFDLYVFPMRWITIEYARKSNEDTPHLLITKDISPPRLE